MIKSLVKNNNNLRFCVPHQRRFLLSHLRFIHIDFTFSNNGKTAIFQCVVSFDKKPPKILLLTVVFIFLSLFYILENAELIARKCMWSQSSCNWETHKTLNVFLL